MLEFYLLAKLTREKGVGGGGGGSCNLKTCRDLEKTREMWTATISKMGHCE